MLEQTTPLLELSTPCNFQKKSDLRFPAAVFTMGLVFFRPNTFTDMFTYVYLYAEQDFDLDVGANNTLGNLENRFFWALTHFKT